MAFTTRTKITALFAIIVSILIVLLNVLIFESANREWQMKKTEYMHTSMDSMLTLDEAKKMFVDLEVSDASGMIIYQQGIFTHNMKHESIASWFFSDPYITTAGGRDYYWGIESKWDGYTYKTVDDITDIIYARDMMIERALWLSLIGFLLVIIVGYTFSGYILRPIYNMNEATRKFSLGEKSDDHHVGIYGNIKDEVVILARSLEELFSRVNKEAERLEQFSDDIAHEIKNKLFEIQSSLDITSSPENRDTGILRARSILKELSHVVDALLFFARNDIGEWEKMDVGNLLLKAHWNTDSRVTLHRESDTEQILYKDLFMTAIGNIVSNAQKFTPSVGRIDVYVRKDGIEIRDTGVGIAKSDITHIFDRLYKVDKARTNSTWYGIGLSITKKIIEDLHKMTLSVKSIEGKWTSFFIKF